MKGGQTPIHIMRFAPADYVNDPFVRGCYRRRDYCTAAFYPAFLFWSQMEGGDLPDDTSALSDLLLMPTRDVVRALSKCIEAGKIKREGGRLYQKRVRAEAIAELEYRENQRTTGKLGGRPRKGHKEEGEPKGTLSDNQSPPSPLPAPTPIPAPTPTRLQAVERPANPLVDRPAMITRGSLLIPRIAAQEDLDPTEVLSKASLWNGRSYVRLDTMPDDRLAHTVGALESWDRKLNGRAEPGPPARAAPSNPRAEQRRNAANALIQGGLDEGRDVGEGDGRTDRQLPGQGPGRGRDEGSG